MERIRFSRTNKTGDCRDFFPAKPADFGGDAFALCCHNLDIADIGGLKKSALDQKYNNRRLKSDKN